MATRKGINIFGHYVVPINAICFSMYVLCICRPSGLVPAHLLVRKS